MHLQAEAYDAAYDAYGKAQALAPDDDAALDGLVRAAAGAGEESMAAVLTLLSGTGCEGHGRDRRRIARGVVESARRPR